MKSRNIILIENEYQALHFLENKEKFNDVLPITFGFDVEKMLNGKVNFETEEKYENEKNHVRLHSETIKEIEGILKNYSLSYRGIDLMQLFYVEIYQFLVVKKRYANILKEIVKENKPEGILVYRSEYNDDVLVDIYSDIAKEIFNGDVNFLKYRYGKAQEKENLFIRLAGYLQDEIGRFKLRISKRKSKVIFLSGTKSLFESTIKQLSKDGKVKVFRCGDSLQKSFYANGKYIPFYQFSGKRNVRLDNLKEKINLFNKKLDSERILGKLIKEKSVISSLGKWLGNIVRVRFLKVGNLINEIVYLIDKEKLDLVLTHSDVDLFQKTLVQTAKSRGIPTVVVQHGVCGHPLGFVPVSSDYFLAWGENSKKRMKKWNVSEKKIRLVGAPQYDYLINKGVGSKNKSIVYIINSSNSKKAIPGHLTKKRQREILEMIYKVMRKFPGNKLIVKTKPGWDLKNLPKKLSEKMRIDNVEERDKANNLELMNSAEVIIIMSSAMGVESLLLNKPVIAVSFRDLKDYTPYNEKYIKTVYNEKQLELAIKDIQLDSRKSISKGSKFLKGEFLALDGKASVRAVNFINKLLRNKKNEI